jgi:hypothetical protein
MATDSTGSVKAALWAFLGFAFLSWLLSIIGLGGGCPAWRFAPQWKVDVLFHTCKPKAVERKLVCMTAWSVGPLSLEVQQQRAQLAAGSGD